MRLLDRYLLRLMVLPLLIGLGVFMLIMLAETAIKLGNVLVGMRVPPRLIALFFLYRLPKAFAWSLPVGVLVGVAMTCTRIACNGEAVGFRAAGASLQRIWAPMFAIGIISSVASFLTQELLVPHASRRRMETFRQMTQTQPVMQSRSNQVFRTQDGRIFYIGHMNEETNRLSRVMIFERHPVGTLKKMTTAEWAERTRGGWLLRSGAVVRFDTNGRPIGKPHSFEARRIEFWTVLHDYYLDKRSHFEMTTRELRNRIAALSIAGHETQRWRVRLQFRYSMPVACIVFALIAAPLGMRLAHLGSFAGILVSILVVFLYNGVRSWGLAFGLVGGLPPGIAAWAQNVIFGGLGLWLVIKQK